MIMIPIKLLLFTTLLAVAAAQFGGLFGGIGDALNTGVGSLANAATQTLGLFTVQFGDYKIAFNRQYDSPEEEEERLKIFSDNLNYIDSFNDAYNGIELGINQFADLTTSEYNTLLNGLICDRSKSHGHKHVPKAGGIPDSVDLREQGLVTPPRSQGRCACCYAFATAGALEGYLYKKTGELPSLSPQNVMDCTKGKPYSNSGCAGGTLDSCYDFIKAKGINGEIIYPYQTKLGDRCNYQEDNSLGNVTGYVLLNEGDEKGLKEAIAKKGPVACGIDAHQKSFQLYKSGIYSDTECKSKITSLNHAVLVVGYTPEYWIVKNSYGTDWGEDGFIRIARKPANQCGLLTYCVYPEL